MTTIEGNESQSKQQPEREYKDAQPPLQRLLIEGLKRDAASERTRRNLDQYYLARANGDLIGVAVCADARVNGATLLGLPAVNTYPSIAAAAPKDAWIRSLTHEGIGSLVVAQHHDGSNGIPLRGCGGLGVKADRIATDATPVFSGVLGYIDQQIQHPEVFTHGFKAAMAVAALTHNQVLAVSIDHLTGLMLPFAAIRNKGKEIVAGWPYSEWSSFRDVYVADPHTQNARSSNDREIIDLIYKDGMLPILEIDDVHPVFSRILNLNRRQVQRLKETYPDLSKTQKVQNPGAVVVSTSVIPAAVRYPETFGQLNTHFGIRLPFIKTGSLPEDIIIDEKELNIAFEQAQYPILHSARADVGDSFFDTHVLLIETKNLKLSYEFASDMIEFEWVKQWLRRREDNEIWIGQVQSGQLQELEVFANREDL